MIIALGIFAFVFLYLLVAMITYSWKERQYFYQYGMNFETGLERANEKLEKQIDKLREKIEDLDEDFYNYKTDLEVEIEKKENLIETGELIAKKEAIKTSLLWLPLLLKRLGLFLLGVLKFLGMNLVVRPLKFLFHVINKLIVPTSATTEVDAGKTSLGGYR